MKIFGATAEKNAAEDKSYAANKAFIMGHPREVIGGAMDEVERKNNLMGRMEVTEEEIVLGILQELSPENKKMWQDEEILSWIRKIVREKLSKKIATAPGAEEDAQSEEGIADAVRIIEPKKPSEKKPGPVKITRSMLKEAERRAEGDVKDD